MRPSPPIWHSILQQTVRAVDKFCAHVRSSPNTQANNHICEYSCQVHNAFLALSIWRWNSKTFTNPPNQPLIAFSGIPLQVRAPIFVLTIHWKLLSSSVRLVIAQHKSPFERYAWVRLRPWFHERSYRVWLATLQPIYNEPCTTGISSTKGQLVDFTCGNNDTLETALKQLISLFGPASNSIPDTAFKVSWTPIGTWHAYFSNLPWANQEPTLFRDIHGMDDLHLMTCRNID